MNDYGDFVNSWANYGDDSSYQNQIERLKKINSHDPDEFKKLLESMVEGMEPEDNYTKARKAIDVELEKKGLPPFNEIMEVFFEAKPEYKL